MTEDRIPSELAREFGDYYLEKAAPRARIGMIVAAIIFVLATLGDARSMPPEVFAWSAPVRLGIVCPILLLLAWVASDPSRFRWHLPMSLMTFGITGLTISAIVFHLEFLGHGWTIHRALLLTFGIYVLSGMRPRVALGLGLALMTLLTGAQLAISGNDPAVVRGLVSLLGANVLGASAAYAIEQSTRSSFLSQVRLRELAERDGLTGLYNRRRLDEHLARVHKQAKRDKTTLAVAMIDVDDFKRFNDSCGHVAGDASLREVARALASCAQRPLDLVARFGGEEFCAVWYGADPESVCALAERCRESIAALEIEHPDSRAGSLVSVSIGAAISEGRDDTLEALVQRADEALYAAKELGRNRVIVSFPEAEVSSAAP